MKHMIIRPHATERWFPSIATDIYDADERVAMDNGLDSVAPQQVTVNLLDLASKPLTFWQRYTGRGLDPIDRFIRLLTLHRRAVRAEIEGHWLQADFYWRDVVKTLRKISKSGDSWEALANAVHANDAGLSADDLRKRVIEEVFVDYHCAFYNGRCPEDEDPFPLDDRAFEHVRLLFKILPSTSFTADEQQSMLRPALLAEIESCKASMEFSLAQTRCREILNRWPTDFALQNELCELIFTGTFESLSGSDSEAGTKLDAELLYRGIQDFEQLRDKYPMNLVTYEYLAQLHLQHAFKLAHSGSLSRALLAARQALANNSQLSEARDALAQITDLMTDLQAKVRPIIEEIHRNPNLQLNAEGECLRNQAEQGFEPMNRFVEREAEAIENGCVRARIHGHWTAIGLPDPPEEGDEAAMVLNMGIVAVLEESPASWDQLLAFVKRIGPETWEKNDVSTPAVTLYLARMLDLQATGEDDDRRFPLVPVKEAEPAARHRREPLLEWIFSSFNLRLKAAATLAFVLVVFVGVATVQDQRAQSVREGAYQAAIDAAAIANVDAALEAVDRFESTVILAEDPRAGLIERIHNWALDATLRQERDPAYTEILAAVRADDLDGVIEQGERFLASLTKAVNDPRTEQVAHLVAQAKLAPYQRQRERAYRDLADSRVYRDHVAVMMAAHTFIAIPSHIPPDPREQEVRESYDRAFVHWYLGRGDELAERDIQLLSQYREFAGQASDKAAI